MVAYRILELASFQGGKGSLVVEVGVMLVNRCQSCEGMCMKSASERQHWWPSYPGNFRSCLCFDKPVVISSSLA